ncbi:MAG: DUF362 domain-containing protein [Verrucomicrobiota bacterium]
MTRILQLTVLLLGLTGLATAETASRVVLVRDPAAVTGWQINPITTHAMVVAGMKQLTGQMSEAAAWQQIISSNDIVGIKVSTLAAPLHVTHQEVLDAIAAGLRQAGVPAINIIVFDREVQKLATAEYRATGFRIEDIVGGAGWDAVVTIENSAVGKLIWGDFEFGKPEPLSTLSHLPKLVTRTITKLINVPVLMDHDTAGLAGCLQNISLGMADNTRRFEQLGQRSDSVIAELAALPAVRTKLVLNICDAFVVGYAGGPSFKPQYSWPHGGLYFSRDPVAIDTMCLDLIETKRREERLPPIGERASHVITAARYGLGQTNATLVEVTR